VKTNVAGLSMRILCLSLVVWVLGSGPAPAQTEPIPLSSPNILFVLVDDLRWDCTGYSGNTVVRTPNIDRLASEGARFDRFYAVTPLCSPSRATILSGLYSHQSENGVVSNRGWQDFAPGTETLPSRLSGLGYSTAFVGKAHLGGDPRSWGFQDTPVWLPVGSSAYQDPQLFVDGRWRAIPGNITHIFTTHALRYLRKRGDDGLPWFLMLSTTAPHGPYCCEDEFPYDIGEIAASPPPGLPPGTPIDAHDWPAYYSAISDLDHQIGVLLAELDELGFRDNTYVFFVSDNGIMGGSHGINRLKGFWWDECSRVPALVRGPGVPAGLAVPHAAMTVDILPTFFDIMGIARPSHLPGRSLLPTVLSGIPVHEAVYGEGETATGSIPAWQMVRSFTGVSADYKYVYRAGENGGAIEELYNLRNDPFELLDLLDQQAPPPLRVIEHLRLLRLTWNAGTR